MNLVDSLAVVKSEHRFPDAPTKPLPRQAGSKADQGPEATRGRRSLHYHEGNDPTIHHALHDMLRRIAEGVGSPRGVTAIANLWTDLRINVKPAGFENCGGDPANFRLV
ncbi:hypothetical protein BIWAKO_03374 [Bosea sp. BIWAKO-01]|nr:hypothetical protein BIWAKO_03374 [Bosea sp. BIWAKO-01]